MQLKDSRGLAVSTGSPAALEIYEFAALQTAGYFGNPLATLDEALAEDADFAAAHALRADLAVMSSEQGALPLIRDSVEQLGFEFADVEILLISHAHFDHNAGSAAIKALTGAKYMVMEGDAAVVESGGKTDVQYGERAIWRAFATTRSMMVSRQRSR